MKIELVQRGSYWVCRLILGLAFISAAIPKIASPQDFADTVAAYQILPISAINLLALGLPIFELACGLSVLSGYFFRIGALGIICMLVIFVAALCFAQMRGLSLDCGCFGSHSWLDSSPWVALIRDSTFLGLTLVGYRYKLQLSSVAQ